MNITKLTSLSEHTKEHPYEHPSSINYTSANVHSLYIPSRCKKIWAASQDFEAPCSLRSLFSPWCALLLTLYHLIFSHWHWHSENDDFTISRMAPIFEGSHHSFVLLCLGYVLGTIHGYDMVPQLSQKSVQACQRWSCGHSRWSVVKTWRAKCLTMSYPSYRIHGLLPYLPTWFLSFFRVKCRWKHRS